MKNFREIENQMGSTRFVRGVERFFDEFWSFAAKGNIIGLAVGVVIGTAFNAIVNSLVTNIITPFLALASTNADLTKWQYTLRSAEVLNGTTTPALVVNYGQVVQVTMNFIIIALCIFIFFKLFSRLSQRMVKKQEAEKKAAPVDPVSTEEKLLSEIRDILKERSDRPKE